MKNNVLKVFAIMIICLFSMSLLSSCYAASVCTIKFVTSPSNPQPGQRVTIEVSATEINEAIAGVGFTLEYDADIFEVVNATATEAWEITQTESLFTLLTKNYEATTTTGKLATIVLKVKDDATKSDTVLKFTKVSAVGDDYKPISIGDISTTINISNKEDQYVNPPADTNNESTNTVPNNNNNNNNANNNNNNSSNVQNTEKPATSSDVDDNKIVVVNGNTGNNNSSKNGDVSTATKNLPKTGVKTISILTIAIAMITMIVSYRAYKRYKNI